MKVTCGYCGAQLGPEQAYDHVRQHLEQTLIVVDVQNLRARLVRHVPVGDYRFVVEEAEPQPPQRMLAAAVWRAGGALNISGIYPPSPALYAWIARRQPGWRRIA